MTALIRSACYLSIVFRLGSREWIVSSGDGMIAALRSSSLPCQLWLRLGELVLWLTMGRETAIRPVTGIMACMGEHIRFAKHPWFSLAKSFVGLSLYGISLGIKILAEKLA